MSPLIKQTFITDNSSVIFIREALTLCKSTLHTQTLLFQVPFPVVLLSLSFYLILGSSLDLAKKDKQQSSFKKYFMP